MNKMGSIKENIILNILRLGLNTLFPVITFPLVSRALGPSNLGKVNFAISITSYFTAFASMGIPNYGIVACSKIRDDKEKLKKTICEILYLNSIFVILAYIIFVCAILWIKQFENYRILLLINSLNVLFTAIGLDWLYTALEDFRYITYRSFIFKMVSLVLIFWGVKQSEDYIIYNCILIVATVGSNLLNFIHAKDYIQIYKLDALNLKQHILPIFTFFAASVAGTINANTDSAMLGIYKGDYSVGIYNFGVKIKTILTSILTAGLGVFFPRFGVLAGKKDFDHYRFLFRKLVIVTMALAIGISLFFILCAKETILILGGKEYMAAMPSMKILTSCIIPLGLTWPLGVGILQVIGKEKEYAKAISYSCIINISANAILIPYFNVVGASIATLSSEIFCAITFFIYSKTFLQGCLKGMKLYIIGFVGSIAFAFCKFLRERIIFDSVVLNLIIYSFLFWGTYIFLLLFMHGELRKNLV